MPKAQRLTKNYIEDIANRYINQGDDENEESPVDSDEDSEMGDVGNDKTFELHSFEE